MHYCILDINEHYFHFRWLQK